MNDAGHPLVLESSLERFLTDNAEKGYLDVVYPYARGAGLIPCKDELLQWSRIINVWNQDKSDNFLSLESMVKYVSTKKGERLFDMLTMLRGKICWHFYDDAGKETESVVLDANGDIRCINVEKARWHSMECLESGSVLFESKDEKYEPLREYEVMAL